MPALAATCVVNNTGDAAALSAAAGCDSTLGAGVITLRSAIEHFNSVGGTNTITFSLPNPSTITLGSALSVTTSGALTITGPGARKLAVDGAQLDRVFSLSDVSNVTITGLTIQNGKVGDGSGGGIQTAGQLVLDAVAVKDNQADYAGGIDVSPVSSSTPTLVMTNSTVSGNSGRAAGISIEGTGISSFTNDTIANNVNNSDQEASGIEVFGPGATLNLNFVTIAGNQYPGPATTIFIPAGLGVYYGATANVHNSVLSGNQLQNCATASGTDPAGTINDLGYNLDSDNTCGFTAAPKHDAVNVAANLGALANNGGQTDTMALGAGSPAIDTADPTCPPPSADQRGTTRPQGTRCDMGAFEVLVAVAVVSPTPSVPTLPQAGHGDSSTPPWAGLLALVAAVATPAGWAVFRRRHRT
jgi:hypothetical protein